MSAVRHAFLVLLTLAPALAGAQNAGGRELKPGTIDAAPRPVCSSVKPTASPSDDERRRARDLAQRGQQAAILGDNASALRDLRDASALDPTDPDLAYQLARAYETAKDVPNATKEYCRFLALSPTAPEAGEVVEKVRILAPPPGPDPALTSALAVFRWGVAAYQRGDFGVADTAFTNVLASDSTWADAYYNRAQVRLARGEREQARADFTQYLQLKPDAEDRASVVAQLSALDRRTFSAFQAFALGAIVPGGGQFYTRRPIRGVLTMAAVGAAAGLAFLQTTKTISVQETATDPFGNPYPITTTHVRKERPYLIPGLATAGGIAALSALNAAFFAHASGREVRRVSMSVVPGANGFAARVAVLTR